MLLATSSPDTADGGNAVWKTPWTGSPHASGYIHDAGLLPSAGLAEFGIAPNSPRLQRGANLSQLFSRNGVPPRGNAPRSTDYQSVALLLSYGGENSPVKVTLPRISDVSRAYCYYTNGRKVVTASGPSPDRTGLRTRALEMLCICGGSEDGSKVVPRLLPSAGKMAPRVGFAPTRLAAPD